MSLAPIPFVDLSLPPRPGEEIRAAIERVVARGWYILGSECEAFETEFARYCGASHCVAVNSGTDALHLALLAMGIGPGDEVITVSHTFIATALAILWTGATPVFVDIHPGRYTIDPAQVEKAITRRTRAILPVHLYGQCADMRPLLELAARHDLKIIEDAAQAHGATCDGQRAGGIGDAGCFSFYPTKNLGALGDGGAIVTRHAHVADRLRQLRNYGQTRKYHHESIGYNSRLDEMQAAVLRVKLRELDQQNARRQQVAAQYRAALAEVIDLPSPAAGCEHVYHLLVVEHAERDALQAHLAQRGIATQVHYPVPAHRQPALAGCGVAAHLPITQKTAERVLSLPIYPHLEREQVLRVAEAIKDFSRKLP